MGVLGMTRVRWLAVLALIVATTGCWPQAGGGAGRTGSTGGGGLSRHTVGGLTEAWSGSVGPREALEPVVVGGTAYVRTDGAVTALATATGAVRWTSAQPGAGLPAALDGELHVPASGRRCELRTLGLGSGQPVRSVTVGPVPFEDPTSEASCGFGDAVAVGGTVAAPWHFVARGPVFGCRPTGAYIEGPGLAAVDAGAGAGAGTLAWEHYGTTAGCGAGGPLPPRYGQPSADGERVLAPWGSRVLSWPLACSGSCPPAWRPNLGGEPAGPAIVLATGDLAVATADGRVLVLDAATGAIAWWGDVGSTVSQPLAASSTHVYATGDDGRVVAFRTGCGADACGPDWTATLPSPASARPSVAGDVLFVGDADGTVSALPAPGCDAPTCEALWTGSTPAEVTGAPAISAGTVLVGSADGTVTAFALP
jgi:outer membrane protein assembly factor BamB